MPLTCPACRAANDAGPACRRCKADLSLLFAIDRQRAAALADARCAAAERRFDDALAALDHAESLRRGDDVRQFRAAVHLLRGDFAAAWSCYDEAGKSDAGGVHERNHPDRR